jgi:hypothetical protein
MKTYIVYENGKLKMKEKGENKKKASNFIKNPKQLTLSFGTSKKSSAPTPLQAPIQISQVQSLQKKRSLIAPPIIEPLKNTYIDKHSIPIQTHQSSRQSSQLGGKKTKANELQFKLFSKLCKIINVNSSNPIGIAIPFNKLQNDNVIQQLYDIQDKLKDAFPSSKLTSLHSNAIKKQSFPGVNIVRQIFKEMGFKLRPVNTSEGYIGKKKILRREYFIEKL